jgi:hypothetical protein
MAKEEEEGRKRREGKGFKRVKTKKEIWSKSI